MIKQKVSSLLDIFDLPVRKRFLIRLLHMRRHRRVTDSATSIFQNVGKGGCHGVISLLTGGRLGQYLLVFWHFANILQTSGLSKCILTVSFGTKYLLLYLNL